MKRIVLLVILSISVFSGKAQNFHITGFLGASNYQGDLQEKVYTFDQANLAYGLGLLYEVSSHLSVRANATMGKISATDKKATKFNNIERNLNFSSSITEVHLGLEYHLFSLYDNMITPYIFAGISGYHFDPYTNDSLGSKVYLQPLGTEGQGFYLGRKKYPLNQIAIPVGGGVKFAISDNIRIGVEIGLRKLLTDYIDDVSTTYADRSQLLAFSGAKSVELAYRGDELHTGSYPPQATIRGNPKSKDWYYFTGLTLSVRIDPGEGRHRSSGKGKYGCPSVN